MSKFNFKRMAMDDAQSRLRNFQAEVDKEEKRLGRKLTRQEYSALETKHMNAKDASNMMGERNYKVTLTLENGKTITERIKAESSMEAESEVRKKHGRPKASGKVVEA